MYDTNFDKQKLLYHPIEVAHWLAQGVTRGPVYTEMELSSNCNQRCIFCGVDYLVNRQSSQIEEETARQIIDDLRTLGNKSIMFSGHGESLLHQKAPEIIRYAASGMSTSVTTNGSDLDESRVDLIDGLEWIRFSVNGTSPSNYAEIHGTDPTEFDRVMTNITGAVRRKRDLGLKVVIGTQIVLLDENAQGLVELGRSLKELGVDYFSVKPYSQHPLSASFRRVDYNRYLGLERSLLALDDESFRVIFRARSMSRVGSPKAYEKCCGTHFICFISANADVWECNVWCGDPRFWTGNVSHERLIDIWTGSRRREVLDFIENEMSLADCRDLCRMDSCNRYLWRLKHPYEHDNFI